MDFGLMNLSSPQISVWGRLLNQKYLDSFNIVCREVKLFKIGQWILKHLNLQKK
jgi:hypothetical protein